MQGRDGARRLLENEARQLQGKNRQVGMNRGLAVGGIQADLPDEGTEAGFERKAVRPEGKRFRPPSPAGFGAEDLRRVIDHEKVVCILDVEALERVPGSWGNEVISPTPQLEPGLAASTSRS